MKLTGFGLIGISALFASTNAADPNPGIGGLRALHKAGLGDRCSVSKAWYEWWKHVCSVGECKEGYCQRQISKDFDVELLSDFTAMTVWIHHELGGAQTDTTGVPESYEKLNGGERYAIFRKRGTTTCSIVHRATYTLQDVATDALSQFLGHGDPTNTGIYLNTAFWDSYNEMSKDLEADVVARLESADCGDDWAMFGFSLAGATIDMALVHLAHSPDRPLYGKVQTVMKGGNPRPFGSAADNDIDTICGKFNALVKEGGKIDRFAHVRSGSDYKDFDSVTAVPFGYHHCSRKSYLLFSKEGNGVLETHIETDVGADVPDDNHHAIEDFLEWVASIIQKKPSFHNPLAYLAIAQTSDVYTKSA